MKRFIKCGGILEEGRGSLSVKVSRRNGDWRSSLSAEVSRRKGEVH